MLYLKGLLGYQVGTEQGACQKTTANAQVLGLVKQGKGSIGLPFTLLHTHIHADQHTHQTHPHTHTHTHEEQTDANRN